MPLVNHAIDELRQKVGEVQANFCPAVPSFFAEVEAVYLWNKKYEETDRWRFDIIIKPHPTVV